MAGLSVPIFEDEKAVDDEMVRFPEVRDEPLVPVNPTKLTPFTETVDPLKLKAMTREPVVSTWLPVPVMSCAAPHVIGAAPADERTCVRTAAAIATAPNFKVCWREVTEGLMIL